ncbi:hypothetical protein BKA67DRAFT_675410 [Truncatella angustata]|uniref:Uncharacterized protein n=1 Tax=Truncatella angustata TaxID=152316 RepID=A0A9P8ZYP2_9PEZI|nr:uncharacterized protein BKA67DRAFT_675410 [Truncatella angustata]KAH6655387.1 hypothetical protein BKA67DRAFT_675410 [Truncatella angustata]
MNEISTLLDQLRDGTEILPSQPWPTNQIAVGPPAPTTTAITTQDLPVDPTVAIDVISIIQMPATDDQAVQTTTCSPNYRGNPYAQSNQSAAISDDDNCAVFIDGMTPLLSFERLFASLLGVGRIYACVIHAPRGEHGTSAVSITGWDRLTAEAIIATVTAGHLNLDGFTPGIRMNRTRVAAQSNQNGSRAIMISGPPCLLHREALEAFFAQYFYYQLDRVVVHVLTEYHAIIEIIFASYRNQAQAAHRTLRQNHPRRNEIRV